MTLEEIVSYRNLEEACITVERNKGVGGVDGMQTDELRDFLLSNYTQLRQQILEECYFPKAVKKVEIPKPDGGKRMLGIPTVIDRMVQQAISQRLCQVYELEFSEHSYGFRPQRNTHQAVEQAKKFLDEGNTFIVELDLEKFFDKVNHDRLISVLGWKVKDQRVLRLIRKYLRSGIMEDGVVSQRTEGTPQGSPLSPLLSNIILDELDKELENRGHQFVRYADDVSIYKKSNKSAERTLESITAYIEKKLLLKVNRTKSKISRPTGSKLLGFSFYKTKASWGIRIAKSSIDRLKIKLKAISKRNNGKNFNTKLGELKPVITGWVNYFRPADAKKNMLNLDGMLRTRLRMGIWKEWKSCKTRVKNLRKLGIEKQKSYEWGNTSRGYCRVAHSPILCRALNNDYFRSQGYVGFSDMYEKKTKLPIPFS
jgi:RNA-directed DNA polymerase